MKTRVLSTILVMFLFGSQALFAQKAKTEKFDVSGKCGMCETRIEKSALSVKGVSKADWNVKTKKIDVSFDSSKTNMKKIHAAIAKAGHDTKLNKASDKTYNALPGCCKYRKE